MWTAESLVKRRGSPLSLASEEPNPKRTELCADSSLITQLFNDKFVDGLACVLAEDEKIVGMAEKLLEDAKSEHGTLDLDAWKYFTSLPIWENEKLMEQYPSKVGPKQEQHLNQQIQETKARIRDEPSLKPLFAEKDHIRVVLILVILFWSRDVGGGTDKEELSNECGFCAPIDVALSRMSLPSEDGMKVMGDLAAELKNDFFKIMGELVGTVHKVSPQGALEHLDKVKQVWGNHRFIDHLLKFEYDVMPEIKSKMRVRLSMYIKSLIKKDHLFEVISRYGDPEFMMRVALSILIGFWSSQDNVRTLVHTMGGDAVGVKKEQSGEGKQESPRDWISNTPNIMEFYRDKSIWKLADQLKDDPEAVNCVEYFLENLRGGECFCSYEDHIDAASTFWHQPSIVLKFNEAMKKDPELVEVLTKYSKGAETLRAQERMIHIRKDFPPESIDSDDSDSKMRLALNILFGYWGDRDVTQLFRSLHSVKREFGKDFDLGEEDDEIAAFYYYASCATDVEGLERWLTNKYGKESQKAWSLAKKIGNYLKDKGKEAESSGYSGGPLIIELVLNKSSILASSLSWSLRTYKFGTLVTGQIPFSSL